MIYNKFIQRDNQDYKITTKTITHPEPIVKVTIHKKGLFFYKKVFECSYKHEFLQIAIKKALTSYFDCDKLIEKHEKNNKLVNKFN